jgi:hypothetical protein
MHRDVPFLPLRRLVVPPLFCLVGALSGATFHVAPDGNDRNPGNAGRPFASFAGARNAVRASGRLGQEPMVVLFRPGVYYLPEPVVFTAADSGAATAPVLYQAEAGGEVVISGGKKLTLKWQPMANGIFTAEVPADLTMDQLFLNGVLQRMARYPNYDPAVAVYGGYATDAFSPTRAAGWADPAGGFIHAMHQYLWGGYHFRITGKNPDNSVNYEGGWQNNRPMGMHDRYRFVENIREELDAPGEWFHDRKARRLLFRPPAGADLARSTIEVARLRSLVELRGTREQPVRFIGFQGFTFRHATRTFMDTKEPLLRSDWSIYRGGAVFFEGAEDCTLDRCLLDQLGGNAVFLSNYNRRVVIRTCWIRGCGASGVAFVGSPAAVRNPLFKYEQRASYAEIDRTPGPLTDDYPADCAVEDSLIMQIGRIEKQVAGVEISMARRIAVRNCTIFEVPRAGINISEGTWGGHLIEGCDVFDTVLETGDHGSFNSWGRDRFWQLRDTPDREAAELALLDAGEPTVIRNSRWRCDHGWDIDLDDGSSNYDIYNNLLLGGGLKLREGFRRHAWNNVIVNNSLHPHVWYPDCGDTFTHNIVMGPYRPALMGAGQWGRELDYNLFTTSAADRAAYAGHGADAHSVVGNPQFVDPTAGDFRVAESSPALALGFRNFPMDDFGVRDPQLRVHARAPGIPPLRHLSAVSSALVYDWLDAQIRDLEGEEYSAFGLSAEAGGVLVLDAPGHAEAVQIGLRTGDVILACGVVAVRTVDDLTGCIAAAPADLPLPLRIRREQKDLKVTLPARPLPPRRSSSVAPRRRRAGRPAH